MSDLFQPQEVGYYETPYARDVTVAGIIIYMTGYQGGLISQRPTSSESTHRILGHVRDSSDNPVANVMVAAGADRSAIQP
jgi:hypothetical protein